MTGEPFGLSPPSRRDRRRRGRRRLGRALLVLALAGAIFALGVGLGQALHDNPDSGRSRTDVRTLTPLPLAPEQETVTVTSASTP